MVSKCFGVCGLPTPFEPSKTTKKKLGHYQTSKKKKRMSNRNPVMPAMRRLGHRQRDSRDPATRRFDAGEATPVDTGDATLMDTCVATFMDVGVATLFTL